MPRVARIVIPDCPHLVTQCGNNRQDIFFADDDYAVYRETLHTQAARFGVAVEGYCLMTSQVHLILTPGSEEALAQAVGRTHFHYTQYVNRRHRRTGHLWQNRFDSCALDPGRFWTAMTYVEQIPVLARRVRKAERYPWSSAAAHITGKDASELLDLAAWRRRNPPAWDQILAVRQDEPTQTQVRLHLSRGRPLGTDKWVTKLEARLGRRLHALPPGRPKGSRKNKTPSRQAK